MENTTQTRRLFLGQAGASLGLLCLSSLTPDLLATAHAYAQSARGGEAKPYRSFTPRQASDIVTLDNSLDAQKRISGQIVRTPFLYSRLLSKLTGAEVHVKMENLQATGAFKERGALNRLLMLTPEERKKGVITMSTGNHAQGVSLHAARLGIKATIYMPENTPTTKIERTKSLGANVVIKGRNFDETAEYAGKNAAADDLTLIHPYNDPAVIAGQGTIALEMLADQSDLDAMIIPVGGGGLITGCAVTARGIKPGIKIYGVESVRYAAMSQCLKGEPVKVGGGTAAEAIAVREVGSVPLEMLPGRIEDILLVEESAIEWAIAAMVTSEKVVAEGAGAVPLAALVSYPSLFAQKKVGVILSGGNIDNSHLSDILKRYRGTAEDKPDTHIEKSAAKQVVATESAPAARPIFPGHPLWRPVVPVRPDGL
jgi:threonine dehydratase